MIRSGPSTALGQCVEDVWRFPGPGNTCPRWQVYPAPVSVNPYSSPVAEGPPHPQAVLGHGEVITPRIMAAMSQTRPWVTFFSVLGFLGAGFIGLGAIGIGFVGSGALEGGLIGFIYLVVAALYGVGANLLYRYRSSIASLERGSGMEALEDALEHQKSFWRFAGLMFAVMLGINVLFVVGAVVLGLITMM